MLMDPDVLPVDPGANLAANEVLCPAASVIGLKPLMLKPEPDAVALVIEMFVVPVFVRVMDCELLLPTFTLPKAMLPGLAASVAVAEVPVPARSRLCGESVALSLN